MQALGMNWDVRIPRCPRTSPQSRSDMPIDLDVALSAELEPAEFSWSSSDVQMYQLGPGAG
jgi:hypothetical protein